MKKERVKFFCPSCGKEMNSKHILEIEKRINKYIKIKESEAKK